MSHNKTIMYLVGGLLVLPIVGVLLVTGFTKNAQVHAQETTRNQAATHMTTMGNMMDSEDSRSMVSMMKEHYGENWQEGCNKMMEELENES